MFNRETFEIAEKLQAISLKTPCHVVCSGKGKCRVRHETNLIQSCGTCGGFTST